jgi:hypothetical protein
MIPLFGRVPPFTGMLRELVTLLINQCAAQ